MRLGVRLAVRLGSTGFWVEVGIREGLRLTSRVKVEVGVEVRAQGEGEGYRGGEESAIPTHNKEDFF